jgi:hypothetical protein
MNAPACDSSDRRLIGATIQIASAVGRRLLNRHQANAAILVATFHAARSGKISRDPVEFARILQHLMALSIDKLDASRTTAQGAIDETVAPLIAIGASSGRIFAEAHNVNEGRGLPLREHEVTELVEIALWRAMQPEAKRYG